MPDPISREPIRRDRIRRIEPGFAFIPNRFLHDGFLESLTDDERILYLFLLVAGDRNGVSYYSLERMQSILRHSSHQILEARSALVRRDLLAFDGLRYQVLDLPEHPMPIRPRSARP